MKTLECSSRGDKRYSAFNAKVQVFGTYASIEEHYQLAKVFLAKVKPVPVLVSDPMNVDTRYVRFQSIKEVKDFQKAGNEPKEMRINGVGYPVEYLSQWYKLLWVKYLDNHPELVEYASQFDEFTDMFRGKAVNCQADVINQYVKEGRQSIMNECRPLLDLLNEKR